MIAVDRFWIPERLSPVEYRALLHAVASISTVFGLIQGNMQWYPKSTLMLLNSLEPDLVAMDEVAEWPGTRTLGRPRLRLLFNVTDRTIDLISQAANSLWDWANTQLPEDLHFLRADRSVVLGSTWCNHNAWLDLRPEEKEHIRTCLPNSLLLEQERKWA